MSNKWATEYCLEAIAIIGMAGRFPKAKTIDEFWRNLREGVESISFFTDEELSAAGIDSVWLSDPNYVKANGVLSDIEMFDASLFNFTPREAKVTDPQHRLFLECAWEALESAGYSSEANEGRVGVYAGAGLNSYLLQNLNLYRETSELTDSYSMLIGNDKDFVPTRASFLLNLKGPSINVSTACSTSLVAVHMGCQSLLNYQCDMVLAGGVSIQVPQKAGYLYQEGMILSPDGHCRAFDAKAQGTVGGSGVGIVVLKRLEEALADGDCIHAVIKGSAINNDGSLKVGYTAPSVDGQAEVISEAQALAGIDAETITYVEAHGTGTPLGDPIEIAALKQAFSATTQKKGFCAIGSVKTNVGHLDAAAGVTGLIKTVLALQHKQLPPSLHFETPNPEIDFANSQFYVNTQLSEWRTNGTPRRAGVSSFGIGGTNAHVVLEEAPKVEPSGTSRPWHLLVLSAKTATALDTATTNLVEHLKQHRELNLADVAYTLSLGRRALNHRRMLVCQDLDEVQSALSTLEPQRVFTQFQEPGERPIAFMFPGQGAQYVNMGRELYQSESIFKEQVDECCELLKPHIGLDLHTVFYPSEQPAQEDAAQQLRQTAIAQPALFVVEYALARLWMAWGVHPEAMIGHSIGEYVAGTIAGVFSLEDALALVAKRGELMQQVPTGSMLSVQLPEQEVQPLLGRELSIAASNAPSYCVVSGSTQAVEELQKQLQGKGVGCRRLHTSHAFHSVMMEPIIEPFTQLLQKVKFNPPKIPFISNVSGTWITKAEATNPNYWARHLRQPVRFSEGITQLVKTPERILLEVGPGRTLSTFAKQHQQEELAALTSLRHPQEQQSDVAFLLNTLGRLWLSGVQVDWSGFYAHERRHRIPLPTYPFERQRYWIEPKASLGQGTGDRGKSKILPNPLVWKSLVEAGRLQACAGIKEFNDQTYLANKQCLERLCTAYMNLGLENLGAFSNPNKKYSIEELFEQCQIIPRYRQLLCRWLNVLVEQGQLQQEQGLFTNLVPFSTDSLNTLLEEVKVRFADTPQVVDTVQQCGENLATVLIGKQEPLELYVALAQKRAEETGEDSNQKLPLYDYCKGIVQASLEQVVKLLPPDVNLRILEIGGGQGIATEVLLPILPSKQTNYTFTDVGGLFLQLAQQKFSAYPFVEYRLLDIERPPSEQGYLTHSFDVVVAVNVLHVTRNMAQTLDHVRSLLAPGGLFLLWEITQPQIEFDMTDGLLMNPLEDEERSQGNPFLSKEQWQEALGDHGFVEVVALSETEAFGHDVLVAQASTSVDLSASSAFTVLVEPKNADQKRQVSLDKKPDIADWFYIPSWKRSMPPQPFDSSKVQATQPGCWLVFADECGLGEKMVQRLELDGHDVITVKVGEHFGRNNKSSQRVYTINPRQRDDYDALFKELRKLNKTPKTIVHLWSVTPNLHVELSIESIEKSEYLGFYSLLFLAQALSDNNQIHSLEIGIVSNNMQEVTSSELLCPEKAMVLGPCKVMPLEYPNINCRSIDVVISFSESGNEQLIDQLLAELTTPPSDQVIAYRGHHRWVQTFEPVRLEGVVEETPRLRQGGVYLITGGLGGVGLTLAEYLAQTVKAKLILIGRSPFPDRDEWSQWLSTHNEQDSVNHKIQKLKALEALGAEVMVIGADVANLEQMSAAVKKANQRFGQIHGVIHTAVTSGSGIIQQITPETAATALAPKVMGTLVLDALFKDAQLDFLVLCSSGASVHGSLGMVDYCADNNFLDAFAHYSASRNSQFIKSINWPRWQGLGWAVFFEAKYKARTGEELTEGMTPEEGIEAFRRILLSSTVPQVLVLPQDFQTAIEQNDSVKSLKEELGPMGLDKPTHPRPSLGTAYVAPRNEVEQIIAETWKQLFGIEQVGIHDNFFELGGDSLFGTMLVSRLCQSFQIKLPYQCFYDAPTIVELAKVIVQELTEGIDQEELAQALANIEQLSDDEAQTILTSQEKNS